MYYFIINGHGGAGKALKKWRLIHKILTTRQIPYKARFAQHHLHATSITKDILSEDDNDIKIIVVGGDGTLNEVVNGLGSVSSFNKVSLGLIPTGSGNDFARALCIPRHNPKKALDKIFKSAAKTAIDIGHVLIYQKSKLIANRFFAISSGFGLDALVCKLNDTSRLKKFLNRAHIGRLSYALITIKSFLDLKCSNITLSTGDKKVTYNNTIFFACMNFPKEGGGVPMSPGASPFDGELSVTVASGVSKLGCFLRFPLLLLAMHSRLKCFDFFNTPTLNFTTSNGGVFHTDGEVFDNVTSAKFDCLPKKLKILV